MVTKKRSGRKAAPRRRVYAARRVAPRRRTNKSGVQYIPGAMATAALVAVNYKKVPGLIRAITNEGRADIGTSVTRAFAGLTGANHWINGEMKKFITANALVTDAAAVAAGYVGGEIVKKYAPGIIKRPLGKIAKKIPKVI